MLHDAAYIAGVIICTKSADIERATSPGGRRCVFVPTMGALHAGHASLIHRGAAVARAGGHSDGCIVSIFVNPTQFNEKADFDRYPKTLEADFAICERAGCSVVYVPSVEDVYPSGEAVRQPALPDVASKPGLEDGMRGTAHFAGVCQVVRRLFDIVRPIAAVFGEKDWQQLQVIRAMTLAERLPIEIMAGETVRETGGLAMSSRNVFLSPESRERALAISMALCEARAAGTPQDAEREMKRVLGEASLDVEYAVVRDAETLLAPQHGRDMRSLIAARVGGVRLIDNAEWRVL